MPVLNQKLNLKGPSISSVLKCEHKYLSRVYQKECVSKSIPKFQAFNPKNPRIQNEIEVPFPLWIKPVRSSSSYLGFYVKDKKSLNDCIRTIQSEIDTFANLFNDLVEIADIKGELNGVGGECCIAEEIISNGLQVTQEGYTHNGKVEVYGTIDSLRYDKEHNSCFRAYRYPSVIPAEVIDEITDLTKSVVAHFDYDNGPFNIEYFWDPETGNIRLLEINSRISKSHCLLFELVDGSSNQQVMIQTALGVKPQMPYRKGGHQYAIKYMLRYFKEGTVTRIPTDEEIAVLQKQFPDLHVHHEVKVGDNLKDLRFQDSYSYELASIFLGGKSPEDLEEKLAAICANLNYIIEK